MILRGHAIDRYLVRQLFKPLLAALGCTVLALLLERALRLLEVFSQSEHRFAFTTQLAINLLPHFLGLTLPAAFFLALFIVIGRLSRNSEVDALLASGVSLTRIAAPLLVMAGVLAIVSLALFGYVQPYSRYAYRAIFHTAESNGWSGLIQSQAFITTTGGFTLTVDDADPTGQHLRGIFVRQVTPKGVEEVTTAATGDIRVNADETATLQLQDGLQLSTPPHGAPRLLYFRTFALEAPLAPAAKLLRARGGDQRELTFTELTREADRPNPAMPRQALLAELYARLARSLVLPLLPLLALPLGLSAKRAGSAPGMMVAAVLLFTFQYGLQLGQSFAASGRAPAIIAVGAPFAAFAAICVAVFLTGRKRPGETPIGLFSERVAEFIARVRPRRS